MEAEKEAARNLLQELSDGNADLGDNTCNSGYTSRLIRPHTFENRLCKKSFKNQLANEKLPSYGRRAFFRAWNCAFCSCAQRGRPFCTLPSCCIKLYLGLPSKPENSQGENE